MTLRIAALYSYPVKSCAAVPHDALTFGPMGAEGDRTWLVVDARGRFVTQRTVGAMARLRATLAAHALHLDHPEAGPLEVASTAVRAERSVTVWDFTGPAIDAGDEAAAWLARALGPDGGYRLVRLPPDHARTANPAWAPAQTPVSFADGYPVLVTSTASLDALNARLEAPLEMIRFRPNIVIDGADAFDEDRWWGFAVDGAVFQRSKPCVRCRVTTLDPATGEPTGPEPLATLSTWRHDASLGGVTFGCNYTSGQGRLRVGATVEALLEAP